MYLTKEYEITLNIYIFPTGMNEVNLNFNLFLKGKKVEVACLILAAWMPPNPMYVGPLEV